MKDIMKLTVWLMMSSMTIYGQADKNEQSGPATPQEIGLSFSGFDDFNLLYKKHNHKGFRARHRLIQGDIGYNSNNRDFDIGLGYAYGRERDKELTDKLDFYHGPEFSIFMSYSNALNSIDERSYNLRVVPSFGYILGVNLSLSEKCYLAVEVLPALRSNFILRDGEFDAFGANISLNSNATRLAIMYRFVRKK